MFRAPTTVTMATFESMTVRELLDEVAARTPAPGGGAVASMVGGLAAALGNMVVAYSLGKKSLAEHAETLESASRRLTVARSLFLRLANEDAAAFETYSELSRLPEDDERRVREMPGAVLRCVQAPRAVLAAAVDAVRLLETLAPVTNKHLKSDLAIAAMLCEAAARAAAWNVRINLPLLASDAQRREIMGDVERSLADVRERTAAVEQACA